MTRETKELQKNISDGVMLENCDIIAIFRIFGQFGAVRRRDSGHRVFKCYVFSNSNFLSYKN